MRPGETELREVFSWSSHPSRRLAPPALRDRHLPSAAERLRRDANRRRGLAAFKLVGIDGTQDFLDERAIVARGGDLVDFLPLLDVQLQDSVQTLVRRQR